MSLNFKFKVYFSTALCKEEILYIVTKVPGVIEVIRYFEVTFIILNLHLSIEEIADLIE